MRDKVTHFNRILMTACVLVSISGAGAQTEQNALAPSESREQRATDAMSLSAESPSSSERQEVTAEELRSLRPAATLGDDATAQTGVPLSAANSPRSTTLPNETEKQIVRNAAPAAAEAPEPTNADQGKAVPKDRQRSAGSWFSLKDFLPLTVVIALILALAWIIRRFKPAQAMLGGGGVLEVVARLPVSSKQTLLLVRMGRQLVLLGQSQDQLTMLTEVNDPEEVSTIIGESVSRTNRSLSHEFAEAFESESTLYERDLELDPAEEARGHVRSLLNRVRRIARSREVA